MNGATTVAANQNFTVTSGASSLSGPTAGSSTALTVAANAASNVGASIQGSANATAPVVVIKAGATPGVGGDAMQIQGSDGSVVQRTDALGNTDALGYIDNGVGGIGAYSNLLLYSEQFDNAAWTKTNVTVTANDGASNPAPDSQTTADKLVTSASNATVAQTYTSSTAGTYTFSVWLKTNATTQPVTLQINSTAGTPTTGTTRAFTATTTWQRMTVSQTFTGSPTAFTPVITISNSGATVVAWGAQLALGTTAQVYTRTVGNTVAANDGVISNGTMLVQPAVDSTNVFAVANSTGANILVVDSTNRQIKIFENGGTTNYAQIYYDTSTTTANYTANSGTVAVGAGAGGISVIAGSGSSITMTANASSLWRTSAGTLTLQSGTTSNLILNSGLNVSVSGTAQVLLGQNAGDPATCNVGAVIYNTTTRTLRGCQGLTPTWYDLVNVTTPTIQATYTASTGGTTPEIKLDTTRGALDIQGDNAGSVTDFLNIHAGTATGLGQSVFDVASTGNVTIQSSAGIAVLATTSTTIQVGSATAHSTNPVTLILDNYQPVTAGAEPTEVDGAMYYDAEQSVFRCGSNALWLSCGINEIESTYNFEDEFLSGNANSTVGTSIGGVGALNWNVTSTTSCTEAYNQNSGPAYTHDHPGVLDLTAGAANGDGCAMTQGGTSAGSVGTLSEILAAGDVFKTNIAASANTGTIRIGWINSTSNTAPTSGLYWQITGGNVQYCYANNTTAVCATAVSLSTNNWFELEIHVNSVQSGSMNITWIVNRGGTLTSNTTTSNFDPGTTNKLGPATTCFASTTTALSCYVDYIQWSGINTSGDGIRD